MIMAPTDVFSEHSVQCVQEETNRQNTPVCLMNFSSAWLQLLTRSTQIVLCSTL